MPVGKRSVLLPKKMGKQAGSADETSGQAAVGIWATGKGANVLADAGSDLILRPGSGIICNWWCAIKTLKQGASVESCRDGCRGS